MPPTCGALYKKDKIINIGGYKKEDGYSADEIFVERAIRKNRWKILHYNIEVAVYTYTKNVNLSSSLNTKRCFVTEHIEHRKEIEKDGSLETKIFLKLWNDSITLWSCGLWQESLMPKLKVTRWMKFKFGIYKMICLPYMYSKVFWYRRMH